MIRRFAAAAVTGAIALTGVALCATGAQADVADGIYKKPYSDTLYQVSTVGGAPSVTELTYEQWKALGFPAFGTAPTYYDKVSWSPVIYGYTDWPGEEFDTLDTLSYEDWAAAGFPVPELGDDYLVAYVQHATSPEIFAVSPAAEFRKLGYADWAALGHPAPEASGAGFLKLTWDKNIVVEFEGETEALTFDEWAAFGLPTPKVAPRFEGDSFAFESPDSPVIVYSGPTYQGPITFAQWEAAGFPAPEAAPQPPAEAGDAGVGVEGGEPSIDPSDVAASVTDGQQLP